MLRVNWCEYKAFPRTTMSLDIEALSTISQPPWQVNEDRRQWVTAIHALHPNGALRDVLRGKYLDEDDGLLRAVQSVAAAMLRVDEAPTVEDKYILIETEYKVDTSHLVRTCQGWNFAIAGLAGKLKYKVHKLTERDANKCILPDTTYLTREKWMKPREWAAFVRAMVQWKTWDLTRNHCEDAANALRECIETFFSVVRQISTAIWPGPRWARLRTYKRVYLDAFRKLGRETDAFEHTQSTWMSTQRFEDAANLYGLPHQPRKAWYAPPIATRTPSRFWMGSAYGASKSPGEFDFWRTRKNTWSTGGGVFAVSADFYGGEDPRAVYARDNDDGNRSGSKQRKGYTGISFLGGDGGGGGSGGGGGGCDGGGGGCDGGG
ncbi:hypothetical protein CYLTODRAFT_442175 [Cylindrobasidium torrendii FP15055 ss-10]|uniref:Uncharacterized protein n=1 Tax=Cylindrobasidium torrendii FP15055 ss-10 TaxID=1314674 RepID=A0A0D7BJA8_9AGAR|nr:hypothetical protein CYLTODRAFT_442175 [Cylindrobasidium torrendii FP15055 ss-10]